MKFSPDSLLKRLQQKNGTVKKLDGMQWQKFLCKLWLIKTFLTSHLNYYYKVFTRPVRVLCDDHFTRFRCGGTKLRTWVLIYYRLISYSVLVWDILRLMNHLQLQQNYNFSLSKAIVSVCKIYDPKPPLISKYNRFKNEVHQRQYGNTK